MRPYRDAVTRISMRQIRASFAPKTFAALERVQVQAGSAAALVKIVSVPSASAHGGRRRWLICPRCNGQTSVIGFVPDVSEGEQVACFRCMRWKTRRPTKVARSAP